MADPKIIEGFSNLTSSGKKEAIARLTKDTAAYIAAMENHLHPHSEVQKIYSELTENAVSNYFLPYSIAPNFLINNKIYHVPMVTEESSVVAAASAAAKFWLKHGGFNCKTFGNIKKGQIHFRWKGEFNELDAVFKSHKTDMIQALSPGTKEMKKRGGGIMDIELFAGENVLKNYFRLEVSFDTVDSMGANFINTCLEAIASDWKKRIEENSELNNEQKKCDILMSILSNYTPGYLTLCELRTKVSSLELISTDYSAHEFAQRFIDAVTIAKNDIGRAVTHNKGIFNGIDAVAIATGNDFRAIEANAHAYASREGQYRSLSSAFIDEEDFVFSIEIPIAMGIVGGITHVHPLAGYSLKILDCKSAAELQGIAVAVGLANNFSAVRALITKGIQNGHMRLHLSNILNQVRASEKEKTSAITYFKDKPVIYSDVKSFVDKLRSTSNDHK